MAAFKPDDTIGVFRIVRLLGKGAMGAVYEVVHTQLGVHYALKSFTLEDGHIDILKEKFLAEGRVLARLHHPHVVRVFDLNFDEATQTPYFVMDLVAYKDGSPHTLADVEVSDLDEEFVLGWFTELASALDYIHAQGIVHRDIKLSNVLLSADKHVILSDFGVLRLFSDRLCSEIRASTTTVAEATNSRLVMGTRGYMAPEVERGEEATPAADVYSLAVMIVYLLTGAWYEPGSRVLELLETLKLPWAKVLPQMLAEDPAERPVDLCALVKSLEVPTSEAKTVVRSIERQSPKLWDGVKRAWRKLPWKAAAIFGGAFAATTAVFTSVWFALRKPAAPQSAEEEVAAAFGVEAIESDDANEIVDVQSQRNIDGAKDKDNGEDLHAGVPTRPAGEVAEGNNPPAGKLYCVVDLSAGPNAANYPVSYLSAEPNGGWTEEYKTTKLVLRRIEPGTFIMGENQNDESHRVTLTKPFYIGIFEMTQKQYELVTGRNPSQHKGDMRPVERVSYDMIRGKGEGAKWPVSHTVDEDSFMGKFRARTGLDFDLPTEVQWEYACRAGTTSRCNNGSDKVSDFMKLSRFKENAADGKGGYSSNHTTVGSYEPNAWGVYDMHGNVSELCLDWYDNGNISYGIFPKGVTSGTRRITRPGCWSDPIHCISSFCRFGVPPLKSSACDGFRLCLNSEGTVENAVEVSGASTAYAPVAVPPSGNLYCVVDLSTGPNATNYPISYLAAEPNGGWTDEYKTTKIVLRRIEAGTFIMGKNQKNESRRVTLTKPFYIGVFEVTQKQYRLVTGGNPSKFKGDMRPVERVSYDMIRGKGEGAKWPVSNAVDAYSFMGKLRARTGLEFDLPTSAQWEFACRAGTTTIYSYGDSANGDYMWYKDNSSSKTHPVGLKRANPWGLYDMHGNVWDFCLDWASRTLNVMTDPRGAFFGKKRKIRGGAFTDMASVATAAVIYEWYPSVKNFNIGFRLCCPAEQRK